MCIRDSYYVILIFQIDEGRQMVTVTVQPRPAPRRTQGGTFVFASLRNQIIADENFIGIIAQPLDVYKRQLANTASGPLIDTITILLGLTVGASTQASEFLSLIHIWLCLPDDV